MNDCPRQNPAYRLTHLFLTLVPTCRRHQRQILLEPVSRATRRQQPEVARKTGSYIFSPDTVIGPRSPEPIETRVFPPIYTCFNRLTLIVIGSKVHFSGKK